MEGLVDFLKRQGRLNTFFKTDGLTSEFLYTIGTK